MGILQVSNNIVIMIIDSSIITLHMEMYLTNKLNRHITPIQDIKENKVYSYFIIPINEWEPEWEGEIIKMYRKG